MVNDILDISKIEAGKMDLYLEDVDLNKLIDEVEINSRPLAAKNTNTLVIDRGPTPLGMAHLDSTKLRQAILNLVSNATKFTHNGEITVRLRRETLPGGDWIEIAVIDTGVGISPDQQDALFSKFTQANAKIASKFGGTGLGLSLSRNLCQLMGGDISVESALHKGSRFTIRLPATASPQEAEVTQAASPNDYDDIVATPHENASLHMKTQAMPHTEARKRVLIVDDDRGFLELAERLLIKEGFNVLATDNPKGALQLARVAKPDVVLLDILMPDFDGWAVLQALKQDPVTAMVPVLILSIVDEKKRARDGGAHAMIAKPIDRTVLLKAVFDACSSGGFEASTPPARAAVA